MKHIYREIAAACQRFPERIAVRGQHCLSYRELDHKINILSQALWHEAHVRPGTRVAVMVAHGPALLWSLLAVLRCRAAYIPIDPGFPKQRQRWILQDADVQCAIAESDSLSTGKIPVISPYRTVEDALPAMAEDILEVEPCNLIYTSGSTGRPKGVVVEHRNLLTTLRTLGDIWEVKEEDVFLAATTISFDIATVELFLPLMYGASIVIGKDITDSELTYAQGRPTQWRLWMQSGWSGNPALTALSIGESLPRDVPGWLVRYIRLTQSYPQVDIFGTHFLLHSGSVGTHQSTG